MTACWFLFSEYREQCVAYTAKRDEENKNIRITAWAIKHTILSKISFFENDTFDVIMKTFAHVTAFTSAIALVCIHNEPIHYYSFCLSFFPISMFSSCFGPPRILNIAKNFSVYSTYHEYFMKMEITHRSSTISLVFMAEKAVMTIRWRHLQF